MFHIIKYVEKSFSAHYPLNDAKSTGTINKGMKVGKECFWNVYNYIRSQKTHISTYAKMGVHC
ncbi:hypothetical protein QTP88_008530 [Uroleucon formosanum]